MHIHNERNFPQAKLDSEIYVPFFKTSMVTCIFYCIMTVNILSSTGQQKRYIGQSVQTAVLWNANYDSENKDYMNALCSRRLKWCDFSINFI